MKKMIIMTTAATVFSLDIRRTIWGEDIKRKLSFLLLITTFSNTLYAQQNRQCGTTEYMQRQMAADPSLAQRIAEDEEAIQKYIASNSNNSNKVNAVITIPVVVHVVYKNAIENISDAQIQSQIAVLNKDYRKLNSDIANVPAVWKNLATDCQIEFCLAQRDEQNKATTGITRTPTTVSVFEGENVKFASKGGEKGWDRNKYLNIWVCNFPTMGLAGPMNMFEGGVVIGYRYFGTTGTVAPPYDKGRTTTHEVGHWLNLWHPWGVDGSGCSDDDHVNDTPKQSESFNRCASFPQVDACSPISPGIMFMNYMNYSDDNCMCMFTTGQTQRMNAILDLYGKSLKTSLACSPVVPFVCDSTKITAQFTNTIVYKGSPTIFTNTSTTTVGNIITNNWTFGDGTTSTLQNPTHTYPDSGSYTVKLICTTDFGCSKTVFKQVKINAPLTISGTESQTIIKNIQFSPNPTTGKLLVNISLQESSDINITIYNMLGESIAVIKDMSSMGDNYSVDLTSQPSGIYFAGIKIGKESVVKKIGIVK